MNLLRNHAIVFFRKQEEKLKLFIHIFIQKRQDLSTTTVPFMYINKPAKKKRSQILHILNLKRKTKRKSSTQST